MSTKALGMPVTRPENNIRSMLIYGLSFGVILVWDVQLGDDFPNQFVGAEMQRHQSPNT